MLKRHIIMNTLVAVIVAFASMFLVGTVIASVFSIIDEAAGVPKADPNSIEHPIELYDYSLYR